MCQYFLFREHRDVRDEYNEKQHRRLSCYYYAYIQKRNPRASLLYRVDFEIDGDRHEQTGLYFHHLKEIDDIFLVVLLW